MPDRRKGSKGRSLKNGESQLPDGRYKFQYTDNDGCRRAVYSWKLVETDRLRVDQRQQESLREKEKRILKDIDDYIKTQSAEQTTVNDMFEMFLQIRIDLRGTTRKCYRDLYSAHVGPTIGNRAVGKVKPSDIQKMYQTAVTEHGVNPSTVQKVLRHTFCTRMCEQGVNLKVLQDIMGHRNIRTTTEVYAKATRDKKMEAMRELNGKFKIS